MWIKLLIWDYHFYLIFVNNIVWFGILEDLLQSVWILLDLLMLITYYLKILSVYSRYVRASCFIYLFLTYVFFSIKYAGVGIDHLEIHFSLNVLWLYCQGRWIHHLVVLVSRGPRRLIALCEGSGNGLMEAKAMHVLRSVCSRMWPLRRGHYHSWNLSTPRVYFSS